MKAEQNKTQLLFEIKIFLEIWKKSSEILRLHVSKDLKILYDHSLKLYAVPIDNNINYSIFWIADGETTKPTQQAVTRVK